MAGYSPWGGKESDTTERLSLQHNRRFQFASTCRESDHDLREGIKRCLPGLSPLFAANSPLPDIV